MDRVAPNGYSLIAWDEFGRSNAHDDGERVVIGMRVGNGRNRQMSGRPAANNCSELLDRGPTIRRE